MYNNQYLHSFECEEENLPFDHFISHKHIFDKGISSYCRGGQVHTDAPFIPICCPQLSDFIPIVLTHYVRLNLNPIIATLQFLVHSLPLSETVCHIGRALI